MSQSKVSKLETGRQLPQVADIVSLGKAAGAAEPVLARLIAEAQRLRLHYQSWAAAQPQGLALGQHSYGLIEQESWSIAELATTVIPGLLQTAAYARGVLALVAHDGEDVGSALAARIKRQAILEDTRRQFRFLLMEGALNYRYCQRNVMDNQLAHIESLSRWENIEVRVLQSGRELPDVPQHSFTLFDESLVLIETISGPLSIIDRSDVMSYASVIDSLWAASASVAAGIADLRGTRPRSSRPAAKRTVSA